MNFTWLNAGGEPFDLTNWLPFAYTKDFNVQPVRTDSVHGVTQITLTKEFTGTLPLGVFEWKWVFRNTITLQVTPPFLSGTVEVKEL